MDQQKLEKWLGIRLKKKTYENLEKVASKFDRKVATMARMILEDYLK